MCALTLSLTSLMSAQAPPKIGVIQIQAALASTKDGQKAASELEAKAAPTRKKIEGKQTEINGLKDQLAKGGSILSQPAKDDLYRNIEAKTKSLNR
jgi:outer membrane protein